MTEITIATSIAPRDFELQRAAIDSWLRLGFKVLSLNSPEEAEIVRHEFPDISVKIAKRTAEAITGKQYVFLDDIFSMLLAEESDICGIVNSDIHLIAADDIQEFICKNAAGSLIFGGRKDVESLADLVGEEYFGGFDFFFFDRSLISLYSKTNFCLGAPWWDYWMPLLPILKGTPVKQLVSPFAYHRNHPTKWSQNVFDDFGLMFAEYLLQEDLQKITDEPLRSFAEKSRTQKESLGPFNLCTLYYLKLNSEKLSYIYSGDCEKKLESTVREYTEGKERLFFYQTQFAQTFKLLHDREESSRRCLNDLQEIHDSWSWRLTAPIRWMAQKVQFKKEGK